MIKKNHGTLFFLSAGSLALGLVALPARFEPASGLIVAGPAMAANFLGSSTDANTHGRGHPGLDRHVDIGHGAIDGTTLGDGRPNGVAHVHGNAAHHMDAGTDGSREAATAFGVSPGSGALRGIYSEAITAERPDVDKGTGGPGRAGAGKRRPAGGADAETY